MKVLPILLLLMWCAFVRAQGFILPYDMEKPISIFNMAPELEEISGLSIHGDYIVAIQDEKGAIYLLDKKYGLLREQIDFGKDADYEGVEVVNDVFYIVKNTGTLSEVANLGKEDQDEEKYNDFLDDDYDVEGLAYDKKNNRLLLACKGKAGDGAEFDYVKAFYAFNLFSKKLEKEPALLISLKSIRDYLDTSPLIRKLDDLLEFFNPNESKFTFSPSGIAIHPKTNDFYILSTAGRLLVIVTPEGEIRHIEKLRKKYHPQPEGICFEKDGTLYIATEGDGGVGRIFKYAYENK